MSDESTVQLGYQELEDHNTLMQLIRTLIHRTDELQFQYETGGVTVHNESETAHADIRQLVTNLSNYVDNLVDNRLAPLTDARIIQLCQNAWTDH